MTTGLGPQSVSNVAIVEAYLTAGYHVVTFPMIGDAKGPRDDGWTTKNYVLADYHEGHRVGIKTGVEISPGKYVNDVDLDWQPGAQIATALLPNTGFMFGRASKPVSHLFYTTEAAAVSRRYDDIDGKVLLELRGTKANGEIGFQTLVPPTIWSNEAQREPLTFVAAGDPAHLPLEELQRAVTRAAIAMLISKHLGKDGFGHDARLEWAGYLLRLGIDVEDLIRMGEAMSVYCRNLEISDVRSAVESTASRLKSKVPRIKGGPALAKRFGVNGKKILARISQWIGRTDVPSVEIRGNQITQIVNVVESALIDSCQIYQRAGKLTRPVKLDTVSSDAPGDNIRREAGSTILIPVTEPWLIEQMSNFMEWYRPSASGERIPADPPGIYARTLIARGSWQFPVLRNVITAPTLAANGRTIDKPGYDAATGLYLDFAPNTFPQVPTHPTKDDALAAIEMIAHPLRGFPFVDGAAKSVGVGAILTALVRSSLRTAPLHGFDSPTAGTGKSLLAEIPALIATGRRPPALSQGKTAEEDEKRLMSVLLAGDLVIHIDNCERAISGDFLSSMLTQEVLQGRVLGKSEMRVLPSTAMVIASGNNLTLAGDMSRRAVIGRLDAKVERPDTRVFDFDCHSEVIASRPELVIAGLTVLRAYAVAENPISLTPMGSFPDWEWIRKSLVWLGWDDPANTRSAIFDNDPRKDELIAVSDLWWNALGNDRVSLADIVALAAKTAPLRDKLIEVACRGQWNAKSVGWWLRRHKDRIVGGRCFRGEQGRVGQVWWLDVEHSDQMRPRIALASAPPADPGM